MKPRLPPATRCAYCGTVAAENPCHICKRAKPHAGDRAVGIASSIVGVMFAILIVGGFA